MGLTYDSNATAATTEYTGDRPKKDYSELEHVPAGTFVRVEVVRCEIVPVRTPKPEWMYWNEEVKWAFKDVEGKWDNRWFWSDVQASMNGKNSKLRTYVENITGIKPLPNGFEFIPEQMIGEQCFIRVGTRFSQAKQKIYNKVDEVIGVHDAPMSTAEVFGTAPSLTYGEDESF